MVMWRHFNARMLRFFVTIHSCLLMGGGVERCWAPQQPRLHRTWRGGDSAAVLPARPPNSHNSFHIPHNRKWVKLEQQNLVSYLGPVDRLHFRSICNDIVVATVKLLQRQNFTLVLKLSFNHLVFYVFEFDLHLAVVNNWKCFNEARCAKVFSRQTICNSLDVLYIAFFRL